MAANPSSRRARSGRERPEGPPSSERTRSMMSRKHATSWLLRVSALLFTLIYPLTALAQHAAEGAAAGGAAPAPHHGGGEANLIVPNLGDTSIAKFMG